MNKLREKQSDKQTAAVGEIGLVRILVTDDHALMRRALLGLLQSQEDFKVVGQAVNGREAVQLATKLKPYVVLMDISMPEMNGFDATAQICNKLPGTRIIGLSTHNDSHTMQKMLDAGASAYLTKQALSEKLVDTICRVHHGSG